ncbi:MAG: DNA mismatch repair protein MutS [Firmicutes bacterium]|nr:DNA mismatch repair protein MutS [Bacillota bacterium]
MKKSGSSAMTPMMVQYLKTKEEYSDCILFYRLGDFYEMFFDDAIKVSRELELTLTGKDCGLPERAPMCGVPHHSAMNYVSRLIARGYKVAICEQTEDPKTAKGIVKREVIRVITPGTVMDEAMLDEKSNNYLAVICLNDGVFGFAVSDVSTGEIYVTELSGAERVMNEIARYEPKEIIINEAAGNVVSKAVELRFHQRVDVQNDDFFDDTALEKKLLRQFKKESLEELGVADKPQAVIAAGVMLRYLEYAQKSSLSYINALNVYSVEQYMDLDASARRNLEITETMRDKRKYGSLLWVLDETSTSMGARMLKSWIEKPLLNPLEITQRLNAVDELFTNIMLKDDLREILNRTYDISRIISRISIGSVTPKDLLSLRMTLCELPELEMKLNGAKSRMLNDMSKGFDILDDVRDLLERAIDDEAPALLKDGGVIKKGFHEEIDKLRAAMKDGKTWLAQLEAKEREKTGIPKMKIGYNKVFGYYFEVSKSNKGELPEYFVRRQTLANAERYITPELKELEDTILGASERVANLEAYVFDEVRQSVAKEIERLKRAANTIAVTDTLCSLAESAYKNRFTKPEVNDSGKIEIIEGRHPVVEKMSKSLFVPNDVTLDADENRLLIITGPNMAGKSTYMRQTALITLMAQIGSFVPAKSAKIGVVDKIFTRVGASDDIASGQSTFMVEMSEVSHILENATKNSLIILDEIGRGTSTYDGLSIAWAVAEYIQSKRNLGAKTLFATHYHELTRLENMLDGVKNYHIAVKKYGDDITFLRKIVRGGTDDSFGIEVAALAGVPSAVIKRAKRVLSDIEKGGGQKEDAKLPSVADDGGQIDFFDKTADEIISELKNTDVTTFTPIEAMNKLYELSNKAKEG